ncbi:hypothetical protein J6590_034641 [Homalodisca vitripennis]|nr:hypothetical protein J6590_034641 [Homalodisca vitripennis]
MAGQADCLRGQDRSVVTYQRSNHAERCLIRLSWDNRRTHYTAPLARPLIVQVTNGLFSLLRICLSLLSTLLAGSTRCVDLATSQYSGIVDFSGQFEENEVAKD